MTATTAKPPGYHLLLRLVDVNGKPFAGKEFRVTWGKDKLRGKTTAEGMIDLVVDGSWVITGGTLELGAGTANVTASGFVPSITIPLAKHQPEGTLDAADRDPDDRAMMTPSVTPDMSYDIAWRLVNLMYLRWIPSTPSFGPAMQMAPSIPEETRDAVRRFKAANHGPLGYADWLDGEPAHLSPAQDDDFVVLLLQQHDAVTADAARQKLFNAKFGVRSEGGSPL